MRQDRRVIADPGADMHGVVARPRIRVRHQHGVARRVAIIQPTLRYEADEHVLVEIDQVVVRRCHVGMLEQGRDYWPRPRPEEGLAAHRSERCLDARMARIVRQHDLLGIGAAHNRQFGLGHRLLPTAGDDNERQA